VTIRLYDEDHYLAEFNAIVTNIDGNRVELNQTAFYAESGGQRGDTGTLNDEKVVNTKYLDDHRCVHLMENEPRININDSIHGKINWDRRYRIMKLHTASHLMEYFLWKQFGYIRRTGSNVDEKKDRADYEYNGRLDPNTLKKVEEETNKFLLEGHPVTISVDNKGIRKWRCGPVEMHCAGTHVKNTSEIGLIKLKRKNPGRGEERVETSLKE
jgi:Ser-tRNA(Ala) deacylase AlaX